MSNKQYEIVVLSEIGKLNIYNIYPKSLKNCYNHNKDRPEYSIIHPLMDSLYGMDYLIDLTQSPETIIQTPIGSFTLQKFYEKFSSNSSLLSAQSNTGLNLIGKYCLEIDSDGSRIVQLDCEQRNLIGLQDYLNVSDCLYRYNKKDERGNIQSDFYHPLYKNGNQSIISIQNVQHLSFYFWKCFKNNNNISCLVGYQKECPENNILLFIQNQKILNSIRFHDFHKVKDIDFKGNLLVLKQLYNIKSKLGKTSILNPHNNINILADITHEYQEIQYNGMPFIGLGGGCQAFIKFKFNNMVLFSITLEKKTFECLMFCPPSENPENYHNVLLQLKEYLNKIRAFPFFLELKGQ